jgi:hypothetical protein
LYQGHRVENITRSDAGAKNLSQTAACLAEIIEDAKANRRKSICFVTGVPGAGKTLAGLNLVTLRTKAHEEEHAVFLSGNGPLVEVLREALARDEHSQSKERGEKTKKSDAARKVNSFVQNIMHFRDSNLVTSDAPIEHVAVFDEAQRAWDAKHLDNFMIQKKGQANFTMSEPEFLVSVMDRHPDWCAIICLVGGGQEINAGEAGLTEWFAALKRSFPTWKIYTSEQLEHRDYPLVAGRGQVNAVALGHSRSQRCAHETIGLDGPDATGSQLLLDARDVGLPLGWADILTKVVSAKLQDDNLRAIGNAARKSRKHSSGGVTKDSGVSDLHMRSPCLEHPFQLGGECLRGSDAMSLGVAGSQRDDLSRC